MNFICFHRYHFKNKFSSNNFFISTIRHAEILESSFYFFSLSWVFSCLKNYFMNFEIIYLLWSYTNIANNREQIPRTIFFIIQNQMTFYKCVKTKTIPIWNEIKVSGNLIIQISIYFTIKLTFLPLIYFFRIVNTKFYFCRYLSCTSRINKKQVNGNIILCFSILSIWINF